MKYLSFDKITLSGLTTPSANTYYVAINDDGKFSVMGSDDVINYFLTNENIGTKIINVDPIGSDTTGNGTLFSPYQTLEKARDISTSGYTIHVLPGSYTATTTDENGLSKDGVDYYFEPNTFVYKTSHNHLFKNLSSFTIGSNVYGYGNFVKSTATGSTFYLDCNLNVNFEFNYSLNTIDTSVIQKNGNLVLKNKILQNSDHAAILLSGGTLKILDVVENIRNSDSGHCIDLRGGDLILNGAILIASGTSAKIINTVDSRNIRIYSGGVSVNKLDILNANTNPIINIVGGTILEDIDIK